MGMTFEFFSDGDSAWQEMDDSLPEDNGVAVNENCMSVLIPGLGRRYVEEVDCEIVETRLG